MSADARGRTRVAVLAGDGIGPEVVTEALRVLRALRRHGLELELAEAPVGGAAIDLTGEPLPDDTLALALASDAVLFGAVGHPRYDHLPPARRPERAIVVLRRAMGLFAGLRHVTVPATLARLSPLRDERVAGTDLLVVRELDGDAYAAQPKGERPAPDGPFAGQREGFDTMRYAEGEVRRVAAMAFRAARSRRGRLTSIDKANVLASSRLWRAVVDDVAKDYPDVALEHQYADSAAAQLLVDPTRFDVLLAGNLFGDIVGDVASLLTGSIGLPASALLGDGSRGLFEPGHGTAPDLAGRGVANPVGCIRAAALMLRHSLGRPDCADRIDAAVAAVLGAGAMTRDLAGTGAYLDTRGMGQAIAEFV